MRAWQTTGSGTKQVRLRRVCTPTPQHRPGQCLMYLLLPQPSSGPWRERNPEALVRGTRCNRTAVSAQLGLVFEHGRRRGCVRTRSNKVLENCHACSPRRPLFYYSIAGAAMPGGEAGSICASPGPCTSWRCTRDSHDGRCLTLNKAISRWCWSLWL